MFSFPIAFSALWGEGIGGRVRRVSISEHGRSIDRYIIENAPQVCCLATRLRGLLSLVSKNSLNSECKRNAHF